MLSERAILVNHFTFIYTQAIICISVVILFVSLVDAKDMIFHIHVHTFSCYISVVGIAFLLYALITIRKHQKRESVQVSDGRMEKNRPHVTHDAEGMNTFLQVGTVVFGLGSLLLDASRLSIFAQTSKAWECEGVAYFVASLLRIIFHFLLLVFLLLHHKVVINFHVPLMRLGLMHVFAGSVGIWATTVILESSHAFVNHPDHDTNSSHGNKTQEEISAEEIRVGDCYRHETFYDEAGDYLFCFMIEFALIAATVTYKMHDMIGAPDDAVHKKEEKTEEEKESCMEMIGGYKGIITSLIGVIVFAGTLTAAIIFMVYEHNGHEHGPLISVLIFLISDIFLNVLAVIFTVLVTYHLSKLLYAEHRKANFDELLLAISMFGFFFLLCFRLATETYHTQNGGLTGTLAILSLVSSLLNTLQSYMQVALIRDGFKRNAKDHEQTQHKHGRRWLTCLICVNLAMWLVNTFELKEIYEGSIYQATYGPLSWLIIVHAFLPLAIFFRFHSAVCLSDIWYEAYEEAEESEGPTSR